MALFEAEYSHFITPALPLGKIRHLVFLFGPSLINMSFELWVCPFKEWKRPQNSKSFSIYPQNEFKVIPVSQPLLTQAILFSDLA